MELENHNRQHLASVPAETSRSNDQTTDVKSSSVVCKTTSISSANQNINMENGELA